MANLDIMEISTLTANGCMLRSGSFKGSENACFDSAADEDLLLKDLDSYWDDLNACLTVSRMVSDSIIRGMVNAVVQEAAENISSKEAEVARLNARLQLYISSNQMSNYSSTESNFLKNMKKFTWEIEDVKMETFIGNQIDKCILSELISELKSQLVDFHMMNKMVEEFYSIILRERNRDLEVEKLEKLKQIASLTSLLNEQETALLLEVKESDKLKQEIVSLLALVEDKNKIALEAESKLEQQKEHFDKVSKELNLLKDQAYEQQKCLSHDRDEPKFLKARPDEASDQIHQYEAKVCELSQKLMCVSNDLEEAGKQSEILNKIIQEKESEVFSATVKSDELMAQMESIITFIQELSRSVAEFQSRILGNIQRQNSRLETLSYQFDSLAKQVDILQRRELWYREKFEIRSFDLKKAETEVDLLGDEVDALLDILGKIYVALDYYSPVLQHYHGVMEILKLVRKELKGTS